MKRCTAISMLLILLLFSSAYGDTIKVVNSKVGFPEGPLWHKNKLFYVAYGSNTLNVWDGKTNSVLWNKNGCGPSAVVAMPSGEFLITCYDSGTIARLSSQGKTIAEYNQDENGQSFQGANDFTLDKKGGVYFTASGPWESDPIVGKIFYINPDFTIREVAANLHYANGIVLSNDGKILYLAESEASRVVQFKVAEDGSLSDRRLFVRVGQVDPESGAYAYPDGLKMDSKGNIYIGQYSKGRILVVSPEKKLLRTLDVPSPAAPNLTFNSDETAVYITAVDDQNASPYWGKVYEIPNK